MKRGNVTKLRNHVKRLHPKLFYEGNCDNCLDPSKGLCENLAARIYNEKSNNIIPKPGRPSVKDKQFLWEKQIKKILSVVYNRSDLYYPDKTFQDTVRLRWDHLFGKMYKSRDQSYDKSYSEKVLHVVMFDQTELKLLFDE